MISSDPLQRAWPVRALDSLPGAASRGRTVQLLTSRDHSHTTVVSIRSASDRRQAPRVDALFDCSPTSSWEFLDSSVSGFLGEWGTAEECDQFGNIDRAERITGLGFVACQAYITYVHHFTNMQKSNSLSFGPCHRTGKRIVDIINHAANYWKHHDECRPPLHRQCGRSAGRWGYSRGQFTPP